MINMLFISQVSGLTENFIIVIYSDIINVINVKLCIVVLLTKLYMFTPLSVSHDIIFGGCLDSKYQLTNHFQWPWLYLKSQQSQTVLTENFVFLSS